MMMNHSQPPRMMFPVMVKITVFLVVMVLAELVSGATKFDTRLGFSLEYTVVSMNITFDKMCKFRRLFLSLKTFIYLMFTAPVDHGTFLDEQWIMEVRKCFCCLLIFRT